MTGHGEEPDEADVRLRLLLDAVVGISAGLSLDGVLGRIVQVASTMLDARYAALGVLGSGPGRRLSSFVQHGISDEQISAIGELPQGRGVLGLLIDHPVPVRLRDIAEHPAASGFPPNHPPMGSFLGVPILIHGQVFGNLYLTEKNGAETFSARDEQIAVALASAAGVAIDNAQMYEESAVRELWLKATAEVTTMLAGTVSGHDALQTIADRAREVAAADVACIASGEDAAALQLNVVSGAPMTPEVRASLGLGRSLAASVVQDGAPKSVEDITADAGLVETGQGIRLGPAVLVPIRLGAGTQGVLGLAWARDHAERYRRVSPAMTANFAEQATLALHLASVRGDRERLAVLEDRDRIGRDLHDLVIQRLFALGLGLQGTARRVDDPETSQRLERAVDDVDETIKEIRRTIFALGSAEREGDIQAEVTRLVERARNTLKFRPSLELEGPVRTLIVGAVAADVLAALAEALSNASRHADPSQVTVRLRAGVRIELTVADDGRGLPEEFAESGLANIRERAIRRGGTFHLHSEPNGGTRLDWSVPVPGVTD